MSQEIKPIMIKKLNNKLPIILNNRNILKKELLPNGNVKIVKFIPFQQDVVYESKSGEFLPGDLRELTIVNRLYKVNNSCRTIAICKSQSGEVFEKTSDDITKLIGQTNYDNLFASLCSIINNELKIRGIFSLLTIPKCSKLVGCQTDSFNSGCVMHAQSQTEDSYITTFKKTKMRRRVKRNQLTPYVVRETPETAPKQPRRLIIEPCNFHKILPSPEKKIVDNGEVLQKSESILPDLGPFLDEDSNNSFGKLSAFSIRTTSDIMNNPLGIFDDVDKVIQKTPNYHSESDLKIHDLDDDNKSTGKVIPVSKTLGSMPAEVRVKLLLHQAVNDWKYCLQRDESGHLPIHVAVLNSDLDLLKRQCVVFKMRGISVDLPADNLTPLRMSLYQDNVQLTTLLLEHNADALASDSQDRNCFHVASEMPTDHLQALINHYRHNARRILEEDEELWKPDYASKTDMELVTILFKHINTLCDSQGYTPLMLASKLGKYHNIRLLLEDTRDAINTKMPSSGNTALYLAVGAACMDAAERGNRSKVIDHFRQTIEILVENGADPDMPNFTGADVNDLLTEYNIGDLSMLIANKMTCRNFSNSKLPSDIIKYEACMLVKDDEGNLSKLQETQKNKSASDIPKTAKKTSNAPKKTSTKNTDVKAEITAQRVINPISSPSSSGKSEMISKIKHKVQNFTLNTPVILKTVKSKTNKRKIVITVEPNNKNKKTNTND